ncbi:MAG: sensor histidine kinase [Kineosporiaceae bacterium]
MERGVTAQVPGGEVRDDPGRVRSGGRYDAPGPPPRRASGPPPRPGSDGPRVPRPSAAWLSGGGRRPAPADLLRNHRSYFLAGILGFRGLSGLPPLIILSGDYGLSGTVTWLAVVWAVAVTANFLVIPRLLRQSSRTTGRVLPWLVLDTAVAVGLNLWGAWIVPGSVNAPYHDLFFFWYLGTVLLWSAWLGPRAGLALCVLAVPVQVLMTLLSGGESLAEAAAMTIGRTAWLLVGTYSGSLILWVMGAAADEVRAEGVRTGHRTAQVEALRHLHDTALQTLEAIGLTAEDERLAMPRRLEAIGRAARQQAVATRAVLSEVAREPRTDPLEEVSRVVTTMRARLQAAGVAATSLVRAADRVRLDSRRVDALARAVHESLENVAKHSRARSAAVEVAARGDRVEAVVRDDGCGFDPARDEGFGIRYSVRERLAEVGGGAALRSSPGRGSSIVLWVPR